MNLRKIHLTGILFLLLIPGFTTFVSAQMSYSDFKARYHTHNDKLISNNDGVDAANEMEVSLLAPVMDSYVTSKEKELFAAIICSVERTHAGNVLNAMEPVNVVQGLNWLKQEWALDVLWYVSENTYNIVAPYIPAITNYTGINPGKLNNDVSKFSPVYVGLGYQLGYSVHESK